MASRASSVLRVAASCLAAGLLLSGCGLPALPDLALPALPSLPGLGGSGFRGLVAADEPHAAALARDALARGGTAMDAAAALGLGLAVALPSRASLGAGGACLAYDPDRGAPEAILFPPVAPARPGPEADRPAAAPMLARGLYLLHAHGGRLSFESLVAPAERLAREGVPVSPLLARDLAQVAGPLAADPNMRAVFLPGPDARPLAEGAPLAQAELAGVLRRMRLDGVGDLYQGPLAQRLAVASIPAGGGLSVSDLRAARPRAAPAAAAPAGPDRAAFLPASADGGATERDFALLQADPAAHPPPATGPLPASTGFAVLDGAGRAVACALTMDNLFGTGRMAPGTGIVLAASPATKPQASLAAAIAWSPNRAAFRAAVAGSGQEAAPAAAAAWLARALRTGRAGEPAPAPGRTDGIVCAGGLPGDAGRCAAQVEPPAGGAANGK